MFSAVTTGRVSPSSLPCLAQTWYWQANHVTTSQLLMLLLLSYLKIHMTPHTFTVTNVFIHPLSIAEATGPSDRTRRQLLQAPSRRSAGATSKQSLKMHIIHGEPVEAVPQTGVNWWWQTAFWNQHRGDHELFSSLSLSTLFDSISYIFFIFLDEVCSHLGLWVTLSALN